MTGTRAVVLASALMVAVPAAAAEARDAQSYRDHFGAQASQRGRQDVGGRRGGPRFDLATNNGMRDGYEAGQKAGQRGNRFDPVREKRYRSGDHGYDRRYGPRDLYKVRYRDAFRRGYQEGYQDGRRYDRRNGRRDQRSPWWWPFGR